MRRPLALVLALVLLLTTTAAAAGPPSVVINGTPLPLLADQQPFIEAGRTLAPMRAIFEALGARVSWHDPTQTVTATKGAITVILTIGAPVAYVNHMAVELEQPARLVGDRTFVPLRFVSEALGATVDWVDSTQTILITLGARELTLEALITDGWLQSPSLPGYLGRPALALPFGTPSALSIPGGKLQVLPGEPLPLTLVGLDRTEQWVALDPALVRVTSPGWELDAVSGSLSFTPDEVGNPPPLTLAWGDGIEQIIPVAWADPGPEIAELLEVISAANREFVAVLEEAYSANYTAVESESVFADYVAPLRGQLAEVDQQLAGVQRRNLEIARLLRELADKQIHIRDCLELLRDLELAVSMLESARQQLRDTTARQAGAQQQVTDATGARDAAEQARDRAQAERDAKKAALDRVKAQRDRLMQFLTAQAGPGVFIGPQGSGPTYVTGGRNHQWPTNPGEALHFNSDADINRWLEVTGPYKEQLKALREAEMEAQQEFDEADAALKEKQQALDQAEQALKQAQAEADAAKAAVRDAEGAVSAFKAEVERIRQALAERNCPMPALTPGAVQEQIRQLEQEADRTTRQRDDLSDEHSRNRDRQKALEEEAQRLRDQIRQAEQDAARKAQDDERRRMEEAERRRRQAAAAAARAVERHRRLLEQKQAALKQLMELQERQGDSALLELLKALEEQLEDLQNSRVTDFFDETGELSEKLEKYAERLTQLRQILSLLEKANRSDLAAEDKAKALQDAYDLARSLGPAAPGIGPFLDFYSEAVGAIAEALGKIERNLAELMMNSGLSCDELVQIYPGNQELQRACQMAKLLKQIRDP